MFAAGARGGGLPGAMTLVGPWWGVLRRPLVALVGFPADLGLRAGHRKRDEPAPLRK